MLIDVIIGLQAEQPQMYENLTKNLNPEEQQVIQAAVNQADAIAAQAEELARQQALAAQGQAQAQQTNGHSPEQRR